MEILGYQLKVEVFSVNRLLNTYAIIKSALPSLTQRARQLN